MRAKEFKDNAQHKPVQIKDSRFGIRKMYFNTVEKSRIGSYANPGRGPNGESQN